MSDPDDKFIANLEELGEEEVRRRLARSAYGSVGSHRPMVLAWLEAKAEARNDASSREQISIARSAKNAAWTAAIAAIIAAIAAALTIYLSGLLPF